MTTIDIFLAILTALAAFGAGFASWYAYRQSQIVSQLQIEREQVTIERERLAIEREQATKEIRDQQQHILDEIQEFDKQFIRHVLEAAPHYPHQISPSSKFATPLNTKSLFEIRQSHFEPEKDLLAERMVDIVADEIESDQQLFMILVLDAGSTVAPMFQKLCFHPTFQFNKFNAERLKIVTNNLPGIADLVNFGRIGRRISAETLFRCRILKGETHSQYAASLGEETSKDLIDAIDKFRDDIQIKQAQAAIKVISVTTGNYVSLQEGILARDLNHLHVKGKMLTLSDEVYVLSPLGKFLPYSHGQVNELLNRNSEIKYRILEEWDQRANLKLVVTKRKHDYFPRLGPLNIHFARIQSELNEKFRNHIITIPFDPMENFAVRTHASMVDVERALRDYELPHRELRESLISKLKEDDSTSA